MDGVPVKGMGYRKGRGGVRLDRVSTGTCVCLAGRLTNRSILWIDEQKYRQCSRLLATEWVHLSPVIDTQLTDMMIFSLNILSLFFPVFKTTQRRASKCCRCGGLGGGTLDSLSGSSRRLAEQFRRRGLTGQRTDSGGGRCTHSGAPGKPVPIKKKREYVPMSVVGCGKT